LIALAVLTLVVWGCGEARTGAVGLSGGMESGAIETTTVTVDCGGQVHRLRRDWEAQLAAGARQDPDARFPNPTRARYEAGLREATAGTGFRIVEDEWLTPLQAAPVLVVQFDDPARPADLSRLERDIEGAFELLDPRAPDMSRPTGGSAFEGFYFEARDFEGVPFLAQGSYSRGDDKGGARWTRFDEFVLRGAPEAITGAQVVLCG
jgi:hypothetical protein